MNNITVVCNAKINLSLDVTGKRADGYHNVELIFMEIPICDTVNVSLRDDGQIILVCDDNTIPSGRENIAYRAAEFFFDEYGRSFGANIELKKNIPHGAGLAGGSADAAGVLKALNTLLSKPFSDEKLMKIGVRLGADVPFCILGGCALGEGVGEILTPLPMPVGLHFVLIKPSESIPTAYVYQNLNLNNRPKNLNVQKVAKSLKSGNMADFYQNCGNIMESVTAAKYPIINEIKDDLLVNGAKNTMMSGSGTTVFGIFESESIARETAEKMSLKHKNVYWF